MPGLVGFCVRRKSDPEANARLLDRMVERTRLPRERLAERYVDEFCAIALLAAEDVPIGSSSIRAPDGRWLALIDGRMLDPPGDIARFAEEMIARRGSPARDLPGLFSAFLYDRHARTLAVLTDRYAGRHLYYFETPDLHAYASNLRAFRALPDPPCRLDREAACDLLNLHLIVGDRTLLEGVSLLPHATLHVLRPEGASRERYWDYPQEPAAGSDDGEALVDPMCERIATAMRRIAAGGPIGILLSGGLDSRMIAGVAIEQGLDVRLFHFGSPGESECDLALQVARALGRPLEIFDARAYDPVPDIEEGARITGGQFAPSQSTFLSFIRAAARATGIRCFLHGLAMDVQFQTCSVMLHRLDHPKDAYEDEDRIAILRKCFLISVPELYPRLLLDPYRSLADPERSLAGIARRHANPDLERFHQTFYYTNRCRRYVMGIARSAGLDAEIAFPGLDPSVFDACGDLPDALRWEAKLYRRMFCRRFPALAAIPYEWTGLPLDRWPPPRKAARRRGERLRYYLSRLTCGRWNRYLLRRNLDRLFREKPGFRSYVEGILLSPLALGRGIYTEEGMRELLRLESTGRNYSSVFLALLGIELFIRSILEEPEPLASPEQAAALAT